MVTKNPNVPTDLRILRRREVQARCGLSRSTIYLKIAQNAFPKQVSLGGGRAVGWVEAEVTAWLEQQIDASRSQ
jgi:prophage regulatory protein